VMLPSLVCRFAPNSDQPLHAGNAPFKCGSEQYFQAV
jgi:hypothetical protein